MMTPAQKIAAVVLCGSVAVSCLMISMRLRSRLGEQSPSSKSSPPLLSSKIETKLGAARPAGQLVGAESGGAITKLGDDRRFESLLLISNPVYAARIAKHLDVRYYEESPAKDTPECREIASLLENEGLGKDAIADAYNAAWDYSQCDTNDVISQLVRDAAVSKIKNKYGVTNQLFFQALFRIKPRIHFGNRSWSLKEGELLSE